MKVILLLIISALAAAAQYMSTVDAFAHRGVAGVMVTQSITRNGGVAGIGGTSHIEGTNFGFAGVKFTRESKDDPRIHIPHHSKCAVAGGAGVVFNNLGAGAGLSGSAECETEHWLTGSQWFLFQPTVREGEGTHAETKRLNVVAGEPAGELLYRFKEWLAVGPQLGALRIHGEWVVSPGPAVKFMGKHASLSLAYGRISTGHHELIVTLRLQRGQKKE